MKVLVTGGAGFIGSNLARALVARGDAVRVLDDCSTGTLNNLSGLDGVDVRVGDIRDERAVAAAVDGVETVFHLAALPSVARSVADPAPTHSVNVDGTLRVLIAARDAGVRRLVYASSSSVYGDTPTLPKHEEMPVAPRSPYAASKLAGESYVRSFASVYAIETLSLRFFNVFGPYQDPSSQYAAVIPRFIAALIEGRSPEVYGDGTQTRDFTFVDNAVSACLLASSASSRASGAVMNVACGERTSLLDLVAQVRRITGSEVDPTFMPPRPGDIKDSHASIAAADRLIGYRPVISVGEGLTRTVEWFTARASAASALLSRRS